MVAITLTLFQLPWLLPAPSPRLQGPLSAVPFNAGLLRLSIRVCFSFAIPSLPTRDADANSPASAIAEMMTALLSILQFVKKVGKARLPESTAGLV